MKPKTGEHNQRPTASRAYTMVENRCDAEITLWLVDPTSEDHRQEFHNAKNATLPVTITLGEPHGEVSTLCL